jgi:hypothetical protein
VVDGGIKTGGRAGEKAIVGAASAEAEVSSTEASAADRDDVKAMVGAIGAADEEIDGGGGGGGESADVEDARRGTRKDEDLSLRMDRCAYPGNTAPCSILIENNNRHRTLACR